MLWSRLCGNAYTASLWISVAQALRGLAAGQRRAAFGPAPEAAGHLLRST